MKNENNQDNRKLRKGDIVRMQDDSLTEVITYETSDGWVNLANGLGEYAKEMTLICKAENREV